jgi:hypothetical protein
MPVIRISDESWDRLKNWATPLEDTPDDAVRKVLDAAEAYKKGALFNLETKTQTIPLPISEGKRIPLREPTKRLLRSGVYARYFEGEKVIITEDTPTALAKALHIRPAKFVLGGRQWDGMTYGTEGYRTTTHAFTTNGFEVDIGEGWGKYAKEDIKPYAKFDARRTTWK